MASPGNNLLIKPVSDDGVQEIPLLRKSRFKYFPAYAQFLLENKLQEIVAEQLRLSREIQLPLLKYFEGFSETELIAIGTEAMKTLLSYCAKNRANEYIEISVRKWRNNQLPFITRNQIIAEDITLFSLMRRKIFRHFLPSYSADIDLYVKIMDEVDRFTVEQDTISFKTLIDIHQELYNQVQSLSHIGNWQWDLKTRRLTWSDELYRIYELEPQSNIPSEKIAAYHHPEDAEMVKKQIKYSLETLQPHDFYYRIILKPGKQKILHAKGEVRLNEEGVPVEMFGTLQDVTTQKSNEKELNEKRNFIQKIADVTPCLLAAYNIQTGKYIFINAAVRTLLGYEPREVLDKGVDFFTALINPDDLQLLMEKNSNALEAANQLAEGAPEPIVEFKYRLKHRNGEYRWFHTFGTIFNRNKDHEVEDLINISIDITEEYLLNQELTKKNEEIKKSEERYQHMISEVEDYAILLLDRNGFIQNWNKGAEKIKGYKAEEIIGKNFRIFYRKEDRKDQLPERLIAEALQRGKASHEGRRVRKDGTTFWGSVVITALHDENNNVIGFSKVTRDLTERKLREEELQQYADRLAKNNEELQKMNKELESFTYMASHDLQEPLRKIRTFCNLILNKAKQQLPQETTEYFNRIITAAERMQKLIEALLNYSRTNTMEIVYEPTDLNIIVAEVQKDLAEIIHEKKARIEFINLPVLQGIPLQFHQVFLNIIENSIKYSRDNVPPVIKVSAALVTKKHHSLSTAGHFYKITIADNGIGFEQEYAENIFKLFQRLHGRNEYYGTGIGLAICKKIVENHRGIITATGKPEKGATFTILLPAE